MSYMKYDNLLAHMYNLLMMVVMGEDEVMI